MARIIERKPCPKCRDEGRDSGGDNLSVFADGGTYCVAGHGFIGKKKTEGEVKPSSTLSIEECKSYPVGHDGSRGISDEVIEMYDVRVSYDEITGVVNRVYYPYYGKDGDIKGFKIRKQPKDFFVAGKLDGVFGKNTCAIHPKGTLFITEGEEDALALKEMFSKSSWSTSDVVSLPNGAVIDGRIDSDVQRDIDFFQRYQRIVLCLDDDEPGRATAKKIAAWLCGFIPDIRIVKLPMKDASDCLKAGLSEPVKKVIKDTKQYRPDGIIHGSEISISDILRAAPVGYSTAFPELDAKLRGLRKGELITVCAGSGIGKSTLVREIGYSLVQTHGLTVCHIALEDVVEATAAAYVAMDNNIPSAKFRSDPSCLPVPAVEASMDRLVRKMYFFNHFGSIDTQSFKEKVLYYARAGVDFIILDHLSMVISGSDVSNERKEIDKIMTDLASMVVSTGVGLINVVHLKRREAREGKGLNEGGSVTLTDLRGSAALEQLSWAVIAMERDQQAEDGSEDFSSVRILKNRTWGRTGKAGKVKYDHKTGRLYPVKEEEFAKGKEEESGSSALSELLSSISSGGPEEATETQP